MNTLPHQAVYCDPAARFFAFHITVFCYTEATERQCVARRCAFLELRRLGVGVVPSGAGFALVPRLHAFLELRICHGVHDGFPETRGFGEPQCKRFVVHAAFAASKHIGYKCRRMVWVQLA